MDEKILVMRDITKVYEMGGEKQTVLKGINLEVSKGEFVAVLGPSGSGKSTLMNIIGCLDTPTSGTYILHGRDVGGLDEDALAGVRSKEIGFIFQSYNLLPNLTATENVAMPLLFRGVPRREREEAARALLKRVGLSHRLDHFPRQMSGGQQQRVGIARAFIARPDVVFADEPTGNLDSKTTVEIMEMICTFARNYHQTIILVTHDPEMASYADRIVTLIDGEIVSNQRNQKENPRHET